ncbi:MAG: hypothetical protein JJT93_08505 [Gammaproteobacteria bacterium]|nr:hypothetical protein [Gammaproteobacteria bacterium]TVQ50278.1 MAG: hypothetical protein EA371_00995 [Gammaproteobacteria bacterium]
MAHLRIALGSALLSLGLAWSTAPGADTLLIEGLEAAAETAPERPRRGMSMAAVERQFGEPLARTPAVGQPPITRWEYPGFIVFFEYELVLHAALARETR